MKLESDLILKEHITELSYEHELPEKLTAEMYLQMYKKIWATVRHDLWKEIQAKKKELRLNELSEKQFYELYEEVYARFEAIRSEIYSKYMDDPEVEQEKAREFM